MKKFWCASSAIEASVSENKFILVSIQCNIEWIIEKNVKDDTEKNKKV